RDQDDDAFRLVAVQLLRRRGGLELAHVLDHAADPASGRGRERTGNLGWRLQRDREPAGEPRQARDEDERQQRRQRDRNAATETVPAAPHAAAPSMSSHASARRAAGASDYFTISDTRPRRCGATSARLRG